MTAEYTQALTASSSVVANYFRAAGLPRVLDDLQLILTAEISNETGGEYLVRYALELLTAAAEIVRCSHAKCRIKRLAQPLGLQVKYSLPLQTYLADIKELLQMVGTASAEKQPVNTAVRQPGIAKDVTAGASSNAGGKEQQEVLQLKPGTGASVAAPQPKADSPDAAVRSGGVKLDPVHEEL